jgi:hypothetical protein
MATVTREWHQILASDVSHNSVLSATRKLPVVATLNKQKCHFFFFFFSYTKSEYRKAEQVLSGELVPVGGGGNKERVWESEHGGILCTHVKMEK